MSESKRVVSAKVVNDEGLKMARLFVTFDNGIGEVSYYTESTTYDNCIIQDLNLNELIGLTSEELYHLVVDAMIRGRRRRA